MEFTSNVTSFQGTTVGSFRDPLNKCSYSDNARGVWYSYTPNKDSIVTFATSSASNYHEIILFSGSSCETATCTGRQNPTITSKASLKFSAVLGSRYYVLVTGYNGNVDAFEIDGTFTINLQVSIHQSIVRIV